MRAAAAARSLTVVVRAEVEARPSSSVGGAVREIKDERTQRARWSQRR